MNKEFEILSAKLNILFDELMWLRRDFQRDKLEKEIKELEYKVKNAQDELNYKKEDNRFIFERIDERISQFKNVEREINLYHERVVEEKQ